MRSATARASRSITTASIDLRAGKVPRALTGRLTLTIASLATVVGFIGAAELATRVLGWGELQPWDSPLRYQRIALPLFTPQPLGDGREVLATSDPRLPFQWIDSIKPAGTRRVFVVGGSAAAGLGYSPNVTIARELERCLAPRLDDEIEVFNLGIVAFASGQVRLLVEHVLEVAEPDCIVVYSGNNEFLELHSRLFAQASGLGPRGIAALTAKSQLVRAVRGAPRIDRAELEASVSTRDLAANDSRVAHEEMLEQIETTPEQLASILDVYESNLVAIANACHDAGVPCVLMTVAVNECWTGVDALGIGELAAEVEVEPTIDAISQRIESASKRDLWRLFHLRARVHELDGDFAAALRDHCASLEADPHLRRATAAHAERVRRAANVGNALLFDTVAPLRERSNPATGAIGFETFYDYVHFRPEGARVVAESLLPTVAAALGIDDLPAGRLESPAPDERDRPWDRGELDALDVDNWIGYAFEPSYVASRDLWKLDAVWSDLDRRIADDPNDWRALAYRGNLTFARPGFEASTERDYRASLALHSTPEVERNLTRLLDDRRLGDNR